MTERCPTIRGNVIPEISENRSQFMGFKYWDTNSDPEKTLFCLLINLILMHTRFRQNHLQNVPKSHCIWTISSVVNTRMIRLIESRIDLFQESNLSSEIDCFIEFHHRQFTRLLTIENVENIVLVVSVLDFHGMHHKLMFAWSISSLRISVSFESNQWWDAGDMIQESSIINVKKLSSDILTREYLSRKWRV